jgi:hypothetical protein
MNIKKSFYILTILVLIYNIDNFLQDTNPYDINKFTKKQLHDKKWRCIVYYYDKNNIFNSDIKYNKYLDKSCNKYKHDYVNFILEKSKIISNNAIIKIIIYIFIIYLYINKIYG